MQEINVLIIEDNPESSSVLENTLKEVGYRVLVAKGPKEGLQLLKTMPIAAAITEVRSSLMNGVEVAKQAHKISARTNVIVITFYSFINSAIEAMEAGAFGYITKPLNTSEIRLVVQRAVERYCLSSSDQEKEHYAQLALIDGLTGLYNRMYFKGLMDFEFARLRRYSGNLSLLMIDIDNFKNYNDTHGHPAGDELLRKLAKLLKGSVREMDVVCRYGGEEFIIVLPQTDKNGAQIVADRMCRTAALYLPNTLSIGVAAYPIDAKDVDALIEQADLAMYKAKQTGKNKVCIANKE